MTEPGSTPDAEKQEARRDEHLAALSTDTEDVPDMTDPAQWRDAPKEGGGA